jgi:hypothetical protein
VNTVMNFGLHQILGNSYVAERLLASQEGLSSTELGICRPVYSNLQNFHLYLRSFCGQIL